MDNQNAPIGNYYQRIQQLTPVANQPRPGIVQAKEPVEAPITSTSLMTPVVFVIAGALASLAIFTAVRYRDFQRSVAIMGLSLVMAIIPVGAKIIRQPTQLDSKASAELTPINIVVQQSSATSVKLSWETTTAVIGAYQISTTDDFTEQLASEADITPATNHEFEVGRLKSGVSYYLRIMSGNVWFDNQGKAIVITTK